MLCAVVANFLCELRADFTHAGQDFKDRRDIIFRKMGWFGSITNGPGLKIQNLAISRLLRLTVPITVHLVASYHDENGNGEFDRTGIGLGPPAFDQAAVEISEKGRAIPVTLPD